MSAEVTAEFPRVRVVILSFDGGDMTIECIESLLRTEWPADRLEILMVDNGSLDNISPRVREAYPSVRILEPLANLGFAGGCNLGMLASPEGDFEPDFIALVNNDATVGPGWLAPLVESIRQSNDIGAVSAKMVFAPRFTGFEYSVESAAPAPDDEPPGVCITRVRLDGERDYDRFVTDESVYASMPIEPESDDELRRWTKTTGSIRVSWPTSADVKPMTVSLRLWAWSDRIVTFRSDAGEVRAVVGNEPAWVDIPVGVDHFDVINNAGSALFAGGFGGDRGFLERDRGQYDEPTEVFAWCGGAVLLRREYLDAVGGFDERFFLYYEDTDLSWRGRLQGWRYVYEPRSLVRHRHAQSSGVGSKIFRFHTERNRLLMLAKCAPLRVAVRAGLGEMKRNLIIHWADLVKRPLTLQMPLRVVAAERRHVLLSYLKYLPGMLRDRWMMDRRVSRRSLMKWEVTK
jgi:GT2 family glycosyltransferase